jgi:hypothetical protein
MGSCRSFSFKPRAQFQEWHGSYEVIPGKTTKFINLYFQKFDFWPSLRYYNGSEEHKCPAIDNGDVKRMALAINQAKFLMTGSKGGSFIINEYGQVIAPSSDGCGRRLLVGQCEGRLLFEDEGEVIDLTADQGLCTGDRWVGPYIGMKYHLHQNSYIYKWNGSIIQPPNQDRELILKIRSIRRFGAVSFIVNPYGIVLMKNPEGDFSFEDDRWGAVYVGKINYGLWFDKEDLQC